MKCFIGTTCHNLFFYPENITTCAKAPLDDFLKTLGRLNDLGQILGGKRTRQDAEKMLNLFWSRYAMISLHFSLAWMQIDSNKWIQLQSYEFRRPYSHTRQKCIPEIPKCIFKIHILGGFSQKWSEIHIYSYLNAFRSRLILNLTASPPFSLGYGQ